MRNQPPPTNALSTELVKHKVLRIDLLDRYPDLDDETLADTLEGLTDLTDIVAEVIRSSLEDQALAAGLGTRLYDMKTRCERLEHRATKKRELALHVMTEANIDKLVQSDFAASVRHGAPMLEITDENAIPAAYWKPQPSKLDRQGVLAALKSGAAIEGAAITKPKLQLTVRTK